MVILVISSCTIKEKMIINEDGSGSFSYGFDMSGIFKLGFKSKDSTKKSKVIDTVFTFKEVFEKSKDSIAKLPADERQKLKILEKFRVNLKSNEDEKQLAFDLEYNFPSTDSLKDMVTPFESLEAMPRIGPGKKLGSLNTLPNKQNKRTLFSYNYDGKVFSKKIVSPADAKKSDKNKKKEKLGDDPFSKKMAEILKECSYSMEYHFPKKIKTVSLKNAVIAKDKKSFVMKIPMQDLPEDEEKLGFIVTFEN
ncbi:hypothetical protein SD960_22785 [Flavobacterium sp. MMLR14_040]|uniref:hypothetical protein n=1 Tax=Flavobacterium sp. MMLR14_040 TaxID=3093843 RepID=UPI00298F9127|nr:hypothetical protein [Flavobacterium sp. MMLR14_040]MDW8852944.1 hypothetical protein [Flavobacterium sp. MMLR14_040]